MAKEKKIYVCSECNYKTPKWTGQCSNCKSWNTLVEQIVGGEEKNTKAKKLELGSTTPASFTSIKNIKAQEHERTTTGIDEVDRVLGGGGFVEGSYVLLSASPGAGKSTLSSQIADNIAKNNKVAIIAGEESESQVRMRLNRLGCKNLENIFISTETNVDKVVEALSGGEYPFAIVDSIQTLYSPDLTGVQGSISQIKQVSNRLQQLSKTHGVTLLVIGQYTKDDSVAGPRTLEHAVDALLTLEGDNMTNYRLLRASKNRFGSVDEVGVFSMEEKGMIEVSDPTEAFLSEFGAKERIGSAISPVIEGSRLMLVEVQALVTDSNAPIPRRFANGITVNKLNMLCAVLARKAGIYVSQADVFVSVVGGFKIDEPALDLAICMAIASAAKDTPIRDNLIFSGEVSLLGEVRPSIQAERRKREASRLGYQALVDANYIRKSAKFNSLRNAIKLSIDEDKTKKPAKKNDNQNTPRAGKARAKQIDFSDPSILEEARGKRGFSVGEKLEEEI